MSLFEVIKWFIGSQVAEHPQLTPWLSDWEPGHETQINIDTIGLEPVFKSLWPEPKEKPKFWTDPNDPDGIEHRSLRIPYGSYTENPSFRDRAADPSITERFAYIGTSGWNWRQQKSMFVGFDFDSIANHSNGLEQDELDNVLQKALELDYTTVRTSKSGKGYHILVYLTTWKDTRTHREHALLAQHVLDRMSRDAGFNFHSAADCCGSILWQWSTDLHHDGLRLIDNK